MDGGTCDLLIFHNRLLLQTVSNAAVKYTERQTVRSGGVPWLNPNAMYVINCSTDKVVECSETVLVWCRKDILIRDFRG